MLALQSRLPNLCQTPIPYLASQLSRNFYKTSYSPIEIQRIEALFKRCCDPQGDFKVKLFSFEWSFSPEKIKDETLMFRQLTGFDKGEGSKLHTLTHFELSEWLNSSSLALKVIALSEAMGLTKNQTVENLVITTIKPFDPSKV